MKKRIFRILPLIVLLVLIGCSDWLDTEYTSVDTTKPWEQNPELWQDYKANLRDYKNRDHYIVYAQFFNSPENPISEKGYMRCLPDSLDMVALSNADNLSSFDKEDMAWMKSIGTKVLYRMDIAAKAAAGASGKEISAYTDKVVSIVKDAGLDGFAITLSPVLGEKTISSIISGLAKTGLTVVSEGDPALVKEADREKIALFVLPTETIELQYDLHNAVQDAIDLGISKEKLILNVSLDGSFKNKSNKELPVVEAFAGSVLSEGPLKGLALCNIESDYYHFEGNWTLLRSTIQILNPSR